MGHSDNWDKRDDPSSPGQGAGGEVDAARVRELETELATAREEARLSNDRWLRERADFENLKKRVERERTETAKFATERVLRDVLPVVDNLQRALAHARGGGDGQPLLEGVELVLKSLLDVLERHGVSRIETKGTRFDPAHHEAMAHVESATHEANAVVDEHQAGYRLHDRLLRPALVSVAKVPSGDPKLAKGEGRD